MNGLNIDFPIYHDINGVRTPFHDLVLRKAVVDGVVMSLSDKITGDVIYNGSDLEFTMQEYVIHNDVKYTLVSPPTVVREGLVKDNSELKGATKYSFEFYHPMYMLSNFPFTDVAVSFDELRYKSQDKSFSWIGKPQDFVNKLNKNLEGTEFVVVLSSSVALDTKDKLSEVLTFDNNTIADALKTGYDTWGLPYVVDKLHEGEYSYITAQYPNGRDYYADGKRFVVLFGLPANEIYASAIDQQLNNPFVFQFGQGVGLKNNSRTPRNNKIVTRIAGYGSETNIPYGYPQIRWYGDPDATCTIGDSVGVKENVTINGILYERVMSYPIYEGIVGGEYVKLIKHPFTRKHLMPTIYYETVFNKVSQFMPNGYANLGFDPDTEIIDYYDAVSETGYNYPNEINYSAPSYEIHEFDDIKPELGEAQILGATPVNADLTDADGWDDTMDDDGNYLQSYFKITLPKLSFDIYACAAITEEMKINMRSGACIGCTFDVQVDWEDYKRNFYDSDMNFAPNGEQRDYTRYPDSSEGSISVVVQKDINTFGTLMPNIYQYPHSGDAFVVLGISLPLSYITSAQNRLDSAMKSYMLENNIHYFDYPLKFDEHFLAKNNNILNQIRPNTIIRFKYNDEDLTLFVKQLTIKYNEGVLPQYDITLTDNIEVVLNQIGKVADDVEKLGTLISLMRQSVGGNVAYELARKLSKAYDDAAAGHITFTKGATFGTYFLEDWIGSGARIDNTGYGVFDKLKVRGSLHAAELVFNLIDAEEGESIRSIGHGEIESVEITSETTGSATLKLDGNEWATIDVGDICRGMYNTIGKDYDNQSVTPIDSNGFQNKKGFFSSYFKILSVTSQKGSCSFTYQLQDSNGEHPCPLMKFAIYGNVDNNKKDRQSCMYISAVGISPRVLFLSDVNTWKINPENIKIAIGNIEGLMVWEECTQAEYDEELIEENKNTWVDDNSITHWSRLKTLHGRAGFYCEQNIYLGGIISQFVSAATAAIESQISNLGQAYVYSDKNSVVVDCSEEGYVLEDTDIGLQASLFFGNQICTLNNNECWFDGLNSTSHPDSIFANTAYKSYTIPQGTLLKSQTITISLVGTYNGNTYMGSKSITIFSQRQGATGNNGQSIAKIKTNLENVLVNCLSNGQVSETTYIPITAELYVGSEKQTSLTYKEISWISGENNSCTPTKQDETFNDGVYGWTFRFRRKANEYLKLSYIYIKMTSGAYTEEKMIPVAPLVSGENGQSSFVSFVFARNYSRPIPNPSGGSFNSPYPDSPANVWFDYIPNGTSPIWFSKRVFTSDEQLPQDEVWSDPKLLADNDNFDIEFSPSESKPNPPDGTNQHNSGVNQIWYDPILDANYYNDHSSEMVWMATRTKTVNAQGNPEWGNWVIIKVKGEDGAGYSANLTRNGDNLIVDAANNIIGGYANRLYTTVDIWENNKERSLTYQSSGNLTDGKYSIALENKVNCNASVDGNGKVTITSIADTSLDGCSVGIVVTTYDGVVMHFTYSVTFTHIDQTYLTFALTNEYDSMSYRTQTKQYVGLPISTVIEAYENDVDGNKKIGDDGSSGYIKSVTVESVNPLISFYQYSSIDDEDLDNLETSFTTTSSIVGRYIYYDGYYTGLRLLLNINGNVSIRRSSGTHTDFDMDDAKHYFDISCIVNYGGVDYNSPKKRLTIAEKTDSTIYRLLLSATAISKEESTFTPATIDVNASITDEQGAQVYTSAQLEQNGNIKVRYIYGAYNTSGSNTLETTFPVLTNYSNKVITVVLVDLTNENSPVYLDIQTVTINEGGKDGAGQAYISCLPNQIIVDCDKDGKPLSNKAAIIKARLRWGDEDCVIASVSDVSYLITSSATGSSNPSFGSKSLYDKNGQMVNSNGIETQLGFYFYQTRAYASGYITITITGTDGNGDTHTASVSVSYTINRKGDNGQNGHDGNDGDDGDDGRGIQSVVTYYKAFAVSRGVTVPSGDPIENGWSASYVEPTEENPFLWRFTRTTYTDGDYDDTNAEFVGMWTDVVNPNLLDDTDFIDNNHLSAWSSIGAWDTQNVSGTVTSNCRVSSTTTHLNHNSFHASVKIEGSESSANQRWYQILCQKLVDTSGVNRIKPDKWYTFSFWVRYYRETNYSSELPFIKVHLQDVCDDNSTSYTDGTQTLGGIKSFNLKDVYSAGGNQWEYHTFTFVSKSSLSGNLRLRLETNMTVDSQHFYICMPKLEMGKMATRYISKTVVSNPFPRTSNWEIGKQYYQGTQGEPYLDIVRYNGQWNRCRVTHVSDENNAPIADTITAFWEPSTDLSFISTDLILANTALIENLIARSLRTAERGPRVEMNGNTIAFYGDLDKPSIELTTGDGGVGVLRFYNANGTIAYDLGPNSITQQYHDVDSIFRETYFKAISGTSTVSAVINYSGGDYIGGHITGISTNQCDKYYWFIEGYVAVGNNPNSPIEYRVSGGSSPSSFNQKYLDFGPYQVGDYNVKSGNVTIIEDGWYVMADSVVDSGIDYVTTKLHKIVSGKIVRSVTIMILDNEERPDSYFDTDGNSHRYLSEVMNSTIPDLDRE